MQANSGGRETVAGRYPAEGDRRAPRDAALSDEALMAAVRARDEHALALLYNRHHRAAFALAYRILRDVGQAEDVVQEAFLAVWRHAGRYEPRRGRLQAWFVTIVRHRAINQLRGRPAPDQLTESGEELVDARQPEVWQQAFAAILQTDIRAALRYLPKDQQQAIDLSFFSGLSHGEIAERLGLPLGTVKSRTRLGFRKLRTFLAHYAA